jgi:hypothetical protein
MEIGSACIAGTRELALSPYFSFSGPSGTPPSTSCRGAGNTKLRADCASVGHLSEIAGQIHCFLVSLFSATLNLCL